MILILVSVCKQQCWIQIYKPAVSQLMKYSQEITLNDLEKLRILGEGTYGKCYLVQNKKANELCVLKQVEIFGMSEDEEKEVMKEAMILSGLDHPYIVKFLTLFKTQSYLNILMEYADGGDLNKTIRDAKGTFFHENQILNWFTQICLAIKHIHDRKIIHRDLKCQNIFMTKEGIIKLGDFGIAKNLSKTLQKIKTIVGTPYYMSPQICENKDYSIKTDIWSLGVILYEMCALKLPFEGSSLPALALKISRGQYPTITANYSRELKALIKSLLQNNPVKRPSISKILQNPLIAKRIPMLVAKFAMNKQFSLQEIYSSSKMTGEKENDQDVFEQSLQGNKSQINLESKSEINSARSHNLNSKPSKTPQVKANAEINGKLIKQFGSNSRSGKIEKEKKKKVQSLRRRQISEPNLALKKHSRNYEPEISLVCQEREEELEDHQQEIQESPISVLRSLVEQIHGSKTEMKYLETQKNMGMGGQPFAQNGILSLLWAMDNLNLNF